ncbi:MAG: hypothetical protein ABI205_09515 [Gemmatimonadaceae bacterium]
MVANDPHGPNSFSNFFDVHEKVMRDYVTRGFVLSDDVAATPVGNGNFIMEGTIRCLGDVDITVEKILEVTPQDGNREPTIRTIDYHYNARIRGVGNILRYDYPHPDHNKFHHVHRYDVFNGDDVGTLTECNWPHLGEVIGELEAWYYENRDRLTGA